jgi:pimeloyl-ACP methyl ester carboxylesterase
LQAKEDDTMAQAHTTATDRRREQAGGPLSGLEARQRLLADMPVSERRLLLAGISTPVLEGGDGPPIVLLHGPLGNAAHWIGIIPGLVATHRAIVPDLPGHGASEVTDDGPIDTDRVMQWLGALIDQTCKTPPVLVGQLLGGAIAARFAAEHGARLHRLVLVDTFGLRPLQPEPEFGLALSNFLAQPTERTHTELWSHCAFDLNALRQRMGEQWRPFEFYNLDRARTPSVQGAVAALMERFGLPAIPRSELAGMTVPTTLIWGRHDRATPLSVAAEASAQFGWPLHVIEDCNDDPPVEQPEALLRTLRMAVGRG